ncbi:MAG: DUF362 domain-containing protein [Synergistaceae bacterium]|nr:DUF362 domain-containing protein [Synergistaceae bacterium]
MSKIFFLSQQNYDRIEIYNAVKKIFDYFGGVGNFVKNGEKVLLKVNLVSGHEIKRRVTTDPSIVYAVAKLILEQGAVPFIADSPGIDNFKTSAEKAGFMDVARELNIECKELTDPVDLPIKNEADYHKIQVSRFVLEADKIINLPKLKTHGQMLLTLGVKNLFGCIPGRLKAGWHYNVGLNREKFASLLLDIYKNINPCFTLLDGIIGMHGEGPTSGEPYNFGILAGTQDALSMDFHLCKMLGAKFEDYPLWLAAKKRNFPECELNYDDVVWEPASHIFPDVKIPKTQSMRLLPRLPFLERLMTSKPVHIPNLCIGCGRCEKICAAGALKHENKKLYFDYKKCIRCYCCHEMCPVKAIEFKESKLLALINKL